jgi:ABC-type multidrug transport system ATPase subunit
VIEVHDQSKRYGDNVTVNDLTFAVEPGHITSFLGSKGAGKSTTMCLILGLDRPHSGTTGLWPLVRYFDSDRHPSQDHRVHRIGHATEAPGVGFDQIDLRRSRRFRGSIAAHRTRRSVHTIAET